MGKFKDTSTTKFKDTTTTKWFGSSVEAVCIENIGIIEINNRTGNLQSFCTVAMTIPDTSAKIKMLNGILSEIVNLSDPSIKLANLITNAVEITQINTNVEDTANFETNALVTLQIVSTTLNESLISAIIDEAFLTSDINEAELILTTLGELLENLTISDISTVLRYIQAISATQLTFSETNSAILTCQVTLHDNVSLNDGITVMQALAVTCTDMININNIMMHYTAQGKVTITFTLTKPSITFTV